MKIKTLKVKTKDGIGRRILALEDVLCREELPLIYTESEPKLEGLNNGSKVLVVLKPFVVYTLKTEDILSEEYFQKVLNDFKLCGHKLKKIKKEIKATQKGWKGEETFII